MFPRYQPKPTCILLAAAASLSFTVGVLAKDKKGKDARPPDSPAAGRYSLTWLIRLMRGRRSKPSSRVMPKPISDWPWLSV